MSTDDDLKQWQEMRKSFGYEPINIYAGNNPESQTNTQTIYVGWDLGKEDELVAPPEPAARRCGRADRNGSCILVAKHVGRHEYKQNPLNKTRKRFK